MATPDIIYLIQQADDNLFKVGYTNNIDKRISTLSTGNPQTLIVRETWAVPKGQGSKCEKEVQAGLVKYQIRGQRCTEFYEGTTLTDLRNIISGIHYRFIDDLENPLVPNESNDKTIDCTDAIAELLDMYNATERQIKHMQYGLATISRNIKRAMNDANKIRSVDGVVLATWTTVESNTFDSTEFRHIHPELWEKFRKINKSQRFLIK